MVALQHVERETGWAGLVRDLRDRDARFAEADRRKDVFLATLAHELRNPLHVIEMGLLLLAESRTDKAGFDETCRMLNRQVKSVMRMVGDLNDVSRVSEGSVELLRERLDAVAVMGRAVDAVLDAAVVRRQVLTYEPPVGCFVEADPARLQQVFVNLLTNAVKYTAEGGVIRFTAAVEASKVVFRVRDTGIGISPEMLPHVFDLYFQIDRSTAGSGGGVGIGLAVVRKLVEAHGGTVEATSDGPGRGSEFVVRLAASP